MFQCHHMRVGLCAVKAYLAQAVVAHTGGWACVCKAVAAAGTASFHLTYLAEAFTVLAMLYYKLLIVLFGGGNATQCRIPILGLAFEGCQLNRECCYCPAKRSPKVNL